MVFTLHWSEEDLQEATKIYSRRVSDRLEDALKDKKRQIQWYSNISDVSRRFHNVFGLGTLDIAEIRFSVESREFRALCVILKPEEAIVYLDIVDKGGSNQQRKLAEIRKRSQDIEEAIRQKYDQSFS